MVKMCAAPDCTCPVPPGSGQRPRIYHSRKCQRRHESQRRQAAGLKPDARKVTPERIAKIVEYQRRRREADPTWAAKTRAASSADALRRQLRRYGLTKDEYARLAADGCMVCGGLNDGKRLCFDHDHDTDGFRGLLCGRCNTGLGQFRDDPDRLVSALQYLGLNMSHLRRA